MQYSAILLALAGLASAQKFSLIAIRSGSDIQNDAITSDGQKLILGGDGSPTTFEVKDNVLYANDKPVQFGNGATIEDTAGQGTKGVIVNGDSHLYVPNYDFTACAAQGQAYPYTVSNAQDCKQGAIPFAARVVYLDSSSSAAAAPKTSAAAPAKSSAAAPAKSEAAAAKPTAGAVVSQINDGQIQAPPSTGPAQANGAASLGVSAVAGVVAVAMLF